MQNLNQPILVNGYWTFNGRKFNEMNTDQQIKFETSFADLLQEHHYKKYKAEYWYRIGDEKHNEVFNILARSPEEAAYITKQQSKFIFKIFIDGKEYKTDRNNRGF